MLRRLALAAPILTLVTSTALAQPSLVEPLPAPASPTEPPIEVTSYRSHILVASGLGIAALVGGAMAEGEDGRDTQASEALFGIGMATTFLAPPLVHIAHGEAKRGLASLGLRWGMASIGGFVAVAAANCDPDVDGWFCDLEAFAPGALAGVAVASLIDALTLTEQRRIRPTERTFAPVLSASSSGGHIGLAGTF